MCGIVGAILAGEDPADLSRVVDSMSHRGPDGRGEARVGRVWFGHRRLSIIDLSDEGAQPMVVHDRGALTFNGEIYDYQRHRRDLQARGERCTTRSDTEVLLRGIATRGERFLDGLHGMFALAWVSPEGREIVLARDHAGMKPLYVWRGAKGFAFASEVRSLAMLLRARGIEPRTNGAALADVLAWGSVCEPRTILRGIEMFPAGHAARISIDDPGQWKLTKLNIVGEAGRSAAGEVRPVVEQAVRRHLVSDRPIALFLSGGIDSGVLAAEIGRSAAAGSTAITVVLGSRGSDDELDIASRTARRHGLDHRIVSADSWQEMLSDFFAAYDQPSIDGLNTFVITRLTKQLGYRVALSGVGADEVFGGYRHLHFFRGRAWRSPALRPIGAALASLATRGPRGPIRRAGLVGEGLAHGEPPQRSFRRVFGPREVSNILVDPIEEASSEARADPLHLEQDTYLRDTLLRDTDVLAMANSVEVRAPYLDPDVLAFVERLGSDEILRRDKKPKWLLREAWRADLDEAATRRGKTGFSLALDAWMRGSGRGEVSRAREGLTKRACVAARAAREIFDASERELEGAHPAAWVPVFALMQIEEQLRRWGEP